MPDESGTGSADPRAESAPPAGQQRPWGRWAALGACGCFLVAALAAIPPAVIGFLMLRPGPSGDALVEARRIVDESVRDARVDPRITRVLGQPIRTRRRTFTSDFDLASGVVDAVVELSGPHGEGQLHVGLQRVYRRWRIEEVRFEELRRDSIDLLEPPRRPSLRREDASRYVPPRRR